MSFSLRNLSVLNYANGFTLWHYKGGNDSLAQLTGMGYFADAADLLAERDQVLISAADADAQAVFRGQGKKIQAVVMASAPL